MSRTDASPRPGPPPLAENPTPDLNRQFRPQPRNVASTTQSAVALLLLIAQPLLFYVRVLFNPSMSIPFDLEGFHLPLAAYIGRCVRQGHFPFWDPYLLCGMPIHADLQAQLYYPLTWISILLGNLTAGHKLFYWIEWMIPLHMILAGVFTFWLLRRLGAGAPAALLGGSVYQLGGYFASQAQHLGAIACGAWLPLALLSVVELSGAVSVRWTAVLALSIAMSILGGFVPATLVVFGAVALVTIGMAISTGARRKFFWSVITGFLLGIAITALETIPAYQLTAQSVAALRYEWHTTGGGLRLQSLASLVWPNYYHIFTPSDPKLFTLRINYTFLYVYCGIIPLLLVLIAPFLKRVRYARMFAGLALLSAFWMLGDETPVYRVFYTHLPQLVRGALYAEFALMAFCLFMALAAAIALQRIAVRAPLAAVWVVVLLTSADLMYFGSGRPMNSADGSYRSRNSEYQINGDPKALRKLQELVGIAYPPVRVDYMDTDFWAGVVGSDLLRLPTPDGDNPFMLRRLLFLRRLFCSGAPWERQIRVSQLRSPLINMLNVGLIESHVNLMPEQLAGTHLELVHDQWGFRFYRNPDALPRFFLVRKLHVSRDETDAFSYLARPDFAPAEEAVVEAQNLRSEEPFAEGQVTVERYDPNRVELKVTTSGRAFLASSEPLYNGWTVTVNGKASRFYMTNGVFRGIILDAGINRIVMTYWPPRYLVWAAISIFSLLVAVAGVIFGGARNPRADASR